MNSSTLSSAIESSPASSRSSSGRTGRVRAMMVVLMKSVTARATSSGSSRERFPVDISEFTILMRLLLCKSYEMPPSAVPSNGSGGYENEARHTQDPRGFDAGLAVGFGLGRERPGAVAGRAARSGRARRSRPLRASGGRPSRGLAFRPGPRLAIRASTGFWSPYYVWWWTGGRVVMLAAPTVTVVNYPTGQYQLRGDGITVPYYWAWVPYQAYVVAPPPPAVTAAPDMPPAGSPPPPPPAAG